jgi:hypothetical protein
VAVGQRDWALADVDDGHARFKCSAECGEADDSWRRDGPTDARRAWAMFGGR